jgi:hypothetical protein
MTVDQFKQDLHQVAKNVRDLVSSLAAVHQEKPRLLTKGNEAKFKGNELEYEVT